MPTAIPSDQRRYQVFVSSTYLDLIEERQAVTSALLESDAFPAGMELFPASDDDAWTLIKRVIDDSDYYLLVIGGKYGSIDPVDDISFTEKEFDYASQAGKPIMAFLHGDVNLLTVEKSERQEDMQQRLAAFRLKVERSKHVKFWTTADNLAGQVALSFNKMTRYFPAVGWVRADKASSAEILTQLAEAKTRVAELESQLQMSTSSPPPGASDLAQGDEPLTTPVWAHAYYRLPSGPRIAAGAWIEHKTTWDEILGILAPSLLIEAEESQLTEAISDWMLTETASAAVKATYKRALAREPRFPKRRTAKPEELKVKLSDADFGTIMLQFKALGMIEKSDRKRSVSDNGNYWRLTSLGEQRAIQARAIKRSQSGATVLTGDAESPDESPDAETDRDTTGEDAD